MNSSPDLHTLLRLTHQLKQEIERTMDRWQDRNNLELQQLSQEIRRLEGLCYDHWPLTEEEKQSFSFRAVYDDRYGTTLAPELDALRNQLHDTIKPLPEELSQEEQDYDEFYRYVFSIHQDMLFKSSAAAQKAYDKMMADEEGEDEKDLLQLIVLAQEWLTLFLDSVRSLDEETAKNMKEFQLFIKKKMEVQPSVEGESKR